MQAQLFAEGEDFYARVPGGAVLRWQSREGSWVSSRAELPDGARQVGFAALPAELREEVIAAVTRAQAVGNPLWDARN